MSVFLFFLAIFLLICWGFGRLSDRNQMHYRAKRQLKYNDVYAEEAAKKEAREERRH
jgi:hypothetical protein